MTQNLAYRAQAEVHLNSSTSIRLPFAFPTIRRNTPIPLIQHRFATTYLIKKRSLSNRTVRKLGHTYSNFNAPLFQQKLSRNFRFSKINFPIILSA